MLLRVILAAIIVVGILIAIFMIGRFTKKANTPSPLADEAAKIFTDLVSFGSMHPHDLYDIDILTDATKAKINKWLTAYKKEVF